MVTLQRSDEFNDWLANLNDLRGKARINARLISAQLGNFGEYRVLDEGVCELKIDFGPGYRVYYVRRACAAEKWSISSCAVATSRRRRRTSSAQWKWRAN